MQIREATTDDAEEITRELWHSLLNVNVENKTGKKFYHDKGFETGRERMIKKV